MERELLVTHDTITRYGERVTVACHIAYLRPRAGPRQQVDDFNLLIEPPPSQRSTGADVFGNVYTSFGLYAPHDTLHVRSTSRVRVRSVPLAESGDGMPWDTVAAGLRYRAGASFEPAVEFVYASPFVPLLAALRDYAAPSFPAGRPLLAGAVELMQRIHADFAYQSGATEIETPLAQVLAQRRGVCQDFAHVMIGCLRSLGLPARYVSGYLLTRSRPGEARLIGADASHAWVSVWCPKLGWNDLDPTNDVRVETSHVTLAVGRDYGDVMPLRGVITGGGEHTLTVGVSVVPVGTGLSV